jgi:hypothetical protein
VSTAGQTPSGSAHGARTGLSGALGLIAGVALVLALAAGYVHDVAGSSDQFADRATSALQAPAVRAVVARRVTDDLVVRNAGQLLAARRCGGARRTGLRRPVPGRRPGPPPRGGER